MKKGKQFLENPGNFKEPIIINKSLTPDLSTEAEETKVFKPESMKDSKFKKRFMNRLPMNSGKLEDAGNYQWIHKPTVSLDLAHSQQLFVQLKSWNTNLIDLMKRLSKNLISL